MVRERFKASTASKGLMAIMTKEGPFPHLVSSSLIHGQSGPAFISILEHCPQKLLRQPIITNSSQDKR